MNGIGKVAWLFNVSPSLLKRLEHDGLIPSPPRTISGFRNYQPEQIEAIKDYFSKNY